MKPNESCDSPSCGCQTTTVTRRGFLELTGLAASGLALSKVVAGPFQSEDFASIIPRDKKLDAKWVKSLPDRGQPTVYRGAELATIGMPIGGIGAGQLYLGGDGKLWHWDIFNLPQPGNFTSGGGPDYAHPPKAESPIEQGFAIRVKAGEKTQTRRLDSEGFDPKHIAFRGPYPLAFVTYHDPAFPVTVELEAFSPFCPLNVDDSALPATVMHYTIKNTSEKDIEVSLAGWLENAACLGSGPLGMGQRRMEVRTLPGKLATLEGSAEETPAASQTPARPEILFEDFENGYGKWTVEGKAFGPEPAAGTLPNQQPVSGFVGKRLVNTFFEGDGTTGKLTSKPFTIERKFIAFLIGGGNQAKTTCMNLLVDGKVVRSAQGRDNERLERAFWNVAEFEGKEARIEIVDTASGPWGHVNVDQIVFSDAPAGVRLKLAEQEDFGSIALALLDGSGRLFAHTRLPENPAVAVFESAQTDSPQASLVPLGTKQVGGLGRSTSLKPGEQAEFTFLVCWYFPGLPRKGSVRSTTLTSSAAPTRRGSTPRRMSPSISPRTSTASRARPGSGTRRGTTRRCRTGSWTARSSRSARWRPARRTSSTAVGSTPSKACSAAKGPASTSGTTRSRWGGSSRPGARPAPADRFRHRLA